jgi:hypothetical protein
MTINVNLTNISTELNSVRYEYDLMVNGKYVKTDEITRETFSAEWLTNYFQKWAYRTYKVGNAQIILHVNEA